GAGAAAVGAPMGDVVTTRADQNIDQQYGRDSVYAFSPESKPLKPEQTSSRETNPFGKIKSYAAEGWQKTEDFASSAWHKTAGLFRHQPSSSALVQTEPQPYGRAGGYVGSDRIAVLESNTPPAANWQNVVTTGESKGNVADIHGEAHHAQTPSAAGVSGSGQRGIQSPGEIQPAPGTSALPSAQHPLDNDSAAAMENQTPSNEKFKSS